MLRGSEYRLREVEIDLERWMEGTDVLENWRIRWKSQVEGETQGMSGRLRLGRITWVASSKGEEGRGCGRREGRRNPW